VRITFTCSKTLNQYFLIDYVQAYHNLGNITHAKAIFEGLFLQMQGQAEGDPNFEPNLNAVNVLAEVLLSFKQWDEAAKCISWARNMYGLSFTGGSFWHDT